MKSNYFLHLEVGRQIGPFSNQVNNGEANLTPTPTVNVYCDYIYLDTDERRKDLLKYHMNI